MIYHTATHNGANKQDPAHNVDSMIHTGNGITVFQHDICKGLDAHGLFKKCDAIHSELAWRAGYDAFTDGTIADGSTFNDYLDGIVRCIRELGLPAFILCGKAMVKRLDPDRAINVRYSYHGFDDARYAIYAFDGDFDVKDEVQGRDFVTTHFKNVLDFSCGYGSLADAAVRNGCNATLSDINTDCIQYVARFYCDGRR